MEIARNAFGKTKRRLEAGGCVGTETRNDNGLCVEREGRQIGSAEVITVYEKKAEKEMRYGGENCLEMSI